MTKKLKMTNAIRFAFLLAFLAASIPPLSAQGTNPFENEIRAFEAEDRQNAPAANSLVFIGSSTINGWNDLAAAFPDYNVLNRGFGGSQMSDALFFFDRIVTPYRPSLVVLYEGDNDLAAGESVDLVFREWTNFVGRVQSTLPNTHVMFVSVKPSPSRIQIIDEQRALNDRIRAHTEADPKLHYVDVFTPMLNDEGQPRPELFVSDRLHMNSTGYALWESVLGPAIDEWAESYPISVTKSGDNSALIDFGSEASLSNSDGAGAGVHWNNVTTTVAASNTGLLTNVVSTAGEGSSLAIQMISRFNGANENGTSTAELFPSTATRDSLFGNTETFSGLSNIKPVFKLTGLPAGATCKATFYASRMGVSDNRQTRYTVTGSTTATADLNAANNINATAVVPEVAADNAGEITIELTPGPQNNNANHFTYLGVLQVEVLGAQPSTFLFDFGTGNSITLTEAAGSLAWNDVPVSIGSTENGLLAGLITTNALETGVDLAIISPFNAANENGTLGSAVFPPSASSDSLYGNTEAFNNQQDVTPVFEFRNLSGNYLYDFSFYASRSGVSDNRETRYTVTGNVTAHADLDAANNVDSVARVSGIAPDAAGTIRIALTPGPNNNNANHFVYLGAMELRWRMAGRDISLASPAVVNGQFSAEVRGAAGMTYQLEGSNDLKEWQNLLWVPLTNSTGQILLPAADSHGFFRLLQ